MYRAEVDIKKADGTVIKKGQIFDGELKKNTIEEFKQRKFIIEIKPDVASSSVYNKENFETDNTGEMTVFLSEEELRKFKSKKEIAEYAETIGCEISSDMRMEEMINEILNYIEEAGETGFDV